MMLEFERLRALNKDRAQVIAKRFAHRRVYHLFIVECEGPVLGKIYELIHKYRSPGFIFSRKEPTAVVARKGYGYTLPFSTQRYWP